MNIKKLLVVFCSTTLFIGCSTSPQIIVDPQFVKDEIKYDKDMEECRLMSLEYNNTPMTLGSALLGGATAVGATAAVLATGGLILLPIGIAAAAGGGALLGGGISDSFENESQAGIWADCMTGRGYKAYAVK
jgi:hypothetical protein